MSSSPTAKRAIQFTHFRIDPDRGELRKEVDSSIEQQYYSIRFELTAARKKAPPTHTMRVS